MFILPFHYNNEMRINKCVNNVLVLKDPLTSCSDSDSGCTFWAKQTVIGQKWEYVHTNDSTSLLPLIKQVYLWNPVDLAHNLKSLVRTTLIARVCVAIILLEFSWKSHTNPTHRWNNFFFSGNMKNDRIIMNIVNDQSSTKNSTHKLIGLACNITRTGISNIFLMVTSS